jgi:hypothetical protein
MRKELTVMAVLALASGCVIFAAWKFDLVGRLTKPNYPRELRELIDRYDLIHEELTEPEVDAILSDFPCRGSFADESDTNGAGSGPFPRTSARVKVFTSKPNPNEGDYFVHVYFDYQGIVVGKRIGEYLR